MHGFRRTAISLLAAVTPLVAADSPARIGARSPRGAWIRPAWPGGEVPRRPDRGIYWFQRLANRVFVYRTEIRIEGPVRWAMARILAAGSWYLLVDGREAARGGGGARPADIDLTEALDEGVHALLVGAPEAGFALAGLVRLARGGERAIATDRAWKAWRYAPATILEIEPPAKAGFDDAAWSDVEVDPERGVTFDPDAAARALWPSEAQRLERRLERARWRLELLARDGTAVVGDEAIYSPSRWDAPGTAVRAAEEALGRIFPLRRKIEGIRSRRIEGRTDGEESWPEIEAIREALEGLEAVAEAGSIQILAAGELRLARAGLRLAREGGASADGFRLPNGFAARTQALAEDERALGGALAEGRSGQIRRIAREALDRAHEVRATLQAAWGAPIARYGTSRFSRLGWIPIRDLVDGELGDWGVRANPAAARPEVDAPRRWRFHVDPDGTGVDRAWHTLGFNVENQWPWIRVPGTWERQGHTQKNPRFPAGNPYPGRGRTTQQGDYNGYAWYRTWIEVPAAWRGRDLELEIDWVEDWDRSYLNDREIGRTGPEAGPRARRRYVVPRSLVRFGERNLLAIRVYDAGGEGGIGAVRVRAPDYRPETEGPTARVRPSFLSPAILIEPEGKALWLRPAAAGPGRIVIPAGPREGAARIEDLDRARTVHDTARDGPLAEGWILFRPPAGEGKTARPIALLPGVAPRRIRWIRTEGGAALALDFETQGVRVAAIRPFAGLPDAPLPEDALSTLRFWSRALRRYPVGYAEFARIDPRDPDRIEVYDVYDDLSLADGVPEKGPRLAPIPPMLALAQASARFAVRTEGARTLPLPPCRWGPLLAREGTGILRYWYARDRTRRLFGFTSWVFMPWDAGVPGNDAECEAMARAGANSYRPQHNFGGEKARIFADFCAKHGLTYIQNPDNKLGGRGGEHGEKVEAWVAFWRGLARRFRDRAPDAVAYDLINEAANMKPGPYNALIRRLTEAIREIDRTHRIYVETCNSWASVEAFRSLAVTGDPHTAYSWHDYRFRLRGDARWPAPGRDVRSLFRAWLPAFAFMARHGVRIHLGEFGGYEKGGERNPCARIALSDCFGVFDQFGMDFHYYPGRGIVWPREDGSVRPNEVFRAFRAYAAARRELHGPQGGKAAQSRPSSGVGSTPQVIGPGSRGGCPPANR